MPISKSTEPPPSFLFSLLVGTRSKSHNTTNGNHSTKGSHAKKNGDTIQQKANECIELSEQSLRKHLDSRGNMEGTSPLEQWLF